eukprot:m.18864 g.18864  ORF g.18864 m.18864 type:complete len:1311 (-) comp11606_c0_seq3:115-4047(-)
MLFCHRSVISLVAALSIQLTASFSTTLTSTPALGSLHCADSADLDFLVVHNSVCSQHAAILNELHQDCNTSALQPGNIVCSVFDSTLSALAVDPSSSPDCDATADQINAVIASFLGRSVRVHGVTCAAGGVLRYDTAASDPCSSVAAVLNSVILAASDGTLYSADDSGRGCRRTTPTTTGTTTVTSSATSSQTTSMTTSQTTTMTTSQTSTQTSSVTTTPRYGKLQCSVDGSIVIPADVTSCDTEVGHLNDLIRVCSSAESPSSLECDLTVRQDSPDSFSYYHILAPNMSECSLYDGLINAAISTAVAGYHGRREFVGCFSNAGALLIPHLGNFLVADREGCSQTVELINAVLDVILHDTIFDDCSLTTATTTGTTSMTTTPTTSVTTTAQRGRMTCVTYNSISYLSFETGVDGPTQIQHLNDVMAICAPGVRADFELAVVASSLMALRTSVNRTAGVQLAEMLNAIVREFSLNTTEATVRYVNPSGFFSEQSSTACLTTAEDLNTVVTAVLRGDLSTCERTTPTTTETSTTITSATTTPTTSITTTPTTSATSTDTSTVTSTETTSETSTVSTSVTTSGTSSETSSVTTTASSTPTSTRTTSASSSPTSTATTTLTSTDTTTLTTTATTTGVHGKLACYEDASVVYVGVDNTADCIVQAIGLQALAAACSGVSSTSYNVSCTDQSTFVALRTDILTSCSASFAHGLNLAVSRLGEGVEHADQLRCVATFLAFNGHLRSCNDYVNVLNAVVSRTLPSDGLTPGTLDSCEQPTSTMPAATSVLSFASTNAMGTVSSDVAPDAIVVSINGTMDELGMNYTNGTFIPSMVNIVCLQLLRTDGTLLSQAYRDASCADNITVSVLSTTEEGSGRIRRTATTTDFVCQVREGSVLLPARAVLAALEATPEATKISLFGFRIVRASLQGSGMDTTRAGTTTGPGAESDDDSNKLSKQSVLILLSVATGVLVLVLVLVAIAIVRRRRPRYVKHAHTNSTGDGSMSWSSPGASTSPLTPTGDMLLASSIAYPEDRSATRDRINTSAETRSNDSSIMSTEEVARLADEVSAWNTQKRQVHFETDYATSPDASPSVPLTTHAHVTSIKQAKLQGHNPEQLLPPMTSTPSRATNASAPPDSAIVLQDHGLGERRWEAPGSTGVVVRNTPFSPPHNLSAQVPEYGNPDVSTSVRWLEALDSPVFQREYAPRVHFEQGSDYAAPNLQPLSHTARPTSTSLRSYARSAKPRVDTGATTRAATMGREKFDSARPPVPDHSLLTHTRKTDENAIAEVKRPKLYCDPVPTPPRQRKASRVLKQNNGNN